MNKTQLINDIEQYVIPNNQGLITANVIKSRLLNIVNSIKTIEEYSADISIINQNLGSCSGYLNSSNNSITITGNSSININYSLLLYFKFYGIFSMVGESNTDLQVGNNFIYAYYNAGNPELIISDSEITGNEYILVALAIYNDSGIADIMSIPNPASSQLPITVYKPFFTQNLEVIGVDSENVLSLASECYILFPGLNFSNYSYINSLHLSMLHFDGNIITPIEFFQFGNKFNEGTIEPASEDMFTVVKLYLTPSGKLVICYSDIDYPDIETAENSINELTFTIPTTPLISYLKSLGYVISKSGQDFFQTPNYKIINNG